MAVCLHPRYISNPQSKEHYLAGLDVVKRLPGSCKYLSPYYRDNLVVPCGKCINCLKNKQNAMVSRCLAEAQKRHTFHFVTLTYDEENLPLAQTLYRVNVETGECEHCALERVTCEGDIFYDGSPTIVHGHRSHNLFLSNEMRHIAPSENPRYLDTWLFDGRDFDGYKYFSRVTPSLNREDVRLWIKSSRIAYLREFGKPLKFSYTCVGEYGPRTCRPHYHLAFFGLFTEEVSWLVERWRYGCQKSFKQVKNVNGDGSDGFTIAARYIGKYMSKGKFECESVTNKDCEKPRVIQSIGLGRSLADSLRAEMCAFDVYGEYDLNTFFCPSLGRSLNETEIDVVVRSVAERNKYCISPGRFLPIPKVIQKVVYYEKSKVDASFYMPTALRRLVSAYLRNKFETARLQEFERFRACHASRPYNEVSLEFESVQNAIAESSSVAGETALRQFYNKSKF